MNEVYSIIEQFDLKVITAVITLIVLINVLLTLLIIARKIVPTESANVKGDQLKAPQNLSAGEVSNPSVFTGIPQLNKENKEVSEISKLESAIKMIKTSGISQLEIASRLNIEPEYAEILMKYHRK